VPTVDDDEPEEAQYEPAFEEPDADDVIVAEIVEDEPEQPPSVRDEPVAPPVAAPVRTAAPDVFDLDDDPESHFLTDDDEGFEPGIPEPHAGSDESRRSSD
jgi:hypothetical protein